MNAQGHGSNKRGSMGKLDTAAMTPAMQRMIGAGSGPYPSPQERASPAFSRKLTAAAKAGEQDAIDKENRITDTRAAAARAQGHPKSGQVPVRSEGK